MVAKLVSVWRPGIGPLKPKFGTGELGSELQELVGEEGVGARPSRIEALRVAGRPGTPEVACA